MGKGEGGENGGKENGRRKWEQGRKVGMRVRDEEWKREVLWSEDRKKSERKTKDRGREKKKPE